MEKKNEEKMLREIETLKSIYQRELTPDELDILKRKYDNVIAKHVELRPGEVDVRQMSQGEYRQLQDRNMRDLLAWAKIISQGLTDFYFLIGGIAKAQGVENPLKASENFAIESEENLKENK